MNNIFGLMDDLVAIYVCRESSIQGVEALSCKKIDQQSTSQPHRVEQKSKSIMITINLPQAHKTCTVMEGGYGC